MPWDIIIVGGGASGLGCAVDAANRGYRTILLEQHDFAKGTSSRSTKLIHGGVRYLQQGNVSLVMEALHERGILRANAPHLVRDLAFVVPNYDWWEAPFYGIGMKVYDLLAGKYGFGPSRILNRQETIEALPTIETAGLRGGVRYFDGQFDDARLALALAQTAWQQGATVLNYVGVTDLVKNEAGWISGVRATNRETGETIDVQGRIVINATGAWADGLRRLEDPTVEPIIRASQGVHIVLDRSFLPGNSAIMVPQTDDGRVLFAIPWHDCIVVGTTDTPIDEVRLEPRAFPEEVDFILTHARRYLTRDPEPADVRSVFVGIRPLVSAQGQADTSVISREHTLHIGAAGLLTLAGGKWTTYRHMAEDTIDQAAMLADLETHPCGTRELRLHGFTPANEGLGTLWPYGSDAERIRDLGLQRPELAEPLHSRLPLIGAQVVWAAEHEMARTVEDVLARRTRCLLFDAAAAAEAAPRVAVLLARALGRDQAWAAEQIDDFRRTASLHRLPLSDDAATSSHAPG